MTIRTLLLDETSAGERLDRALARLWPDLSRSRLQGLIREGAVTVAGRAVDDPSARVGAGAAIVLDEPPPVPAAPASEPMPLTVVFEDDAVIVVEKPAGLVVHPAPGHAGGTLVNALLAHCGDSLSGIGGVRRPGIVHRIDKDTSGLLVVAKTDRAHASLAGQFADHGRTGPLERAYLAFVWGVPEPRRGTVDAALARSTRNREKICVVAADQGRQAITHYEVVEALAGGLASLVSCRLETGRTHQIRVHMAEIDHPLVGDALYGSGFRTKASRLDAEARTAVDTLRRQALHATLLQFEHPATGAVMRFESPLPEDLRCLHAAMSGAT